jgi:hypothetical protein
VSKRHGRRKKKRRHPRPLACPRCHSPADGTPGALLQALAAVLNSCADAGLKVKFAHGSALTREGYVLPLGGGRFAVRTPTYNPFPPPEDPSGLDD